MQLKVLALAVAPRVQARLRLGQLHLEERNRVLKCDTYKKEKQSIGSEGELDYYLV